MAPRKSKPAAQASPGSLGDFNFLDSVAKPAKPKSQTATTEALIISSTEELASVSSEAVDGDSPEQGSRSKRQASRISKHHVSLYISPAVDRAFKRIALDEERKGWEIYHQALREYLDRKGQSFDDLMSAG